VDHLIPGLAVDPSTAGASGHLALSYYFYPNANCSVPTCQLEAGFISSSDGGGHWGGNEQLAGPMSLSWLAFTTQGFMVGDYISTSFVGGKALPVIADAGPGTPTQNLNEATFTTSSGLTIAAGGAASTSGAAAASSPTSFVVGPLNR
jgi:hypothetical protein